MKYILNNDNLEVVGKQYLSGVGKYTGDTTNASDLATVINAKAEKSEIPTETTVSNWGFTKNQGTVKDVKVNDVSLTQNNGEVNITAASTSNYGVTKLSSAVNSESEVLAATSKALKAAYDLANSKQDKITLKTINNTELIGSGNIEISAASLGLASALKYCGTTTTPLTDGATTNPVVIDGKNHTAEAGCVVFYKDGENTKEFVFNGTKWELLGSDLTYKVVQSAVSSPNANGNAVSFIDTISQDANGVITATKKNVDMPIVKGDVENSAVLKGEYEGYSNKAISQISMAVGAATTAGLKGWYYSAIDFTNNTITLSDKQPSVFLGHLSGGAWSSETPNIKAGDKVSIVNNAKYDYCGEVKTISGNKVTLKSALPFDSLDTSLISINNPDDWSIYLPDNESAGIIDFGGGALAEGVNTKSTNIGSHAEGIQTHAYGQYSHTEGFKTAAGYAAHAEGKQTKAIGEQSHSEGTETQALGNNSHAEGKETKATNYSSHAEGYGTVAGDKTTPVTINDSPADGCYSHAEGNGTRASGHSSHSEGKGSTSSGNMSHAEGLSTESNGNASHAEGNKTKTFGSSSHSEGITTTAGGIGSHAEGTNTTTGIYNSTTKQWSDGNSAHAEGYGTTASASYSHAEGEGTIASGIGSHAEGKNTSALGRQSHAQGENSHAVGNISFASGRNTYATSSMASAFGDGTIANNISSTAFGSYNVSIEKTNTNTAADATFFSIGIGRKNTDDDAATNPDKYRKNAFEVKQNGDIYIEGVEGKIQDKLNVVGQASIISVTYNDIAGLRRDSKLIPGQQYRITDYVTTTVQENTQSAGHQFDIIVTADDVNVLNENARAIQHTNDENDYFHDSNLAAWELKYCLDNDTNRFAWADTENGKGVIYYMKDEWNNECPYDFKNIQFARWELSNPVGYKKVDNEWVEDSNVTETYGQLKVGFYGLSNTDNVFTFGNGKFKVEYTISAEPTYCYTFGKDSDYGLTGSNYCNVIKEYKYGAKIGLNNIVFLGSNCYNNTFGNSCYNNTFGDGCQSNTFGHWCYYNTFGNSCASNTFEKICIGNTFGEYCVYNIFGNIYNYNTFGNECQHNTFGNGCQYNTFGNGCQYNTFGNGCQYNTFGNECDSITFGNICQYNTFGNICQFNTFGDECQNNTFGYGCTFNTFGDGCYSIAFGNICAFNTFGDGCYNISFSTSASENGELKDYCSYNHIENGVHYVNIWNELESDGSNQLKNIRVKRGVCGTPSECLDINVIELGMSWEWIVAFNSSKQIKQYCEADLIA